VSEPGSPRDDDAARAEALFRYRVIAPLLDEPAQAPLRARVAEVASHRHPHPSRGEVAISIRTLWTWLERFRGGGIDALRPRHRRDHGTLRALDAAALDRAEVLRRELPARWTSTVIDILVRERTVAKAKVAHRATIDRHLRRRGASRRQLVVLGAKPTIKMRFDSFGDLWGGDYHHGPKVLAPAGHATTAKLGAFIDHTTRYPVADRWYLAEDVATLRDTLLRALLTWARRRSRTSTVVPCTAPTSSPTRWSRSAHGWSTRVRSTARVAASSSAGGSSPMRSRPRSTRATSW
jgi:hypothetical protein